MIGDVGLEHAIVKNARMRNKKYIIWSGKKGTHGSTSFVLDFKDGKYSVFQFDEIKIF